MNKRTIITIECGNNSLVFSPLSNLWITKISSLSSNDVVIDETQGTGQIGSSISILSVQPKDLTVEGFIKNDIEPMREGLLSCLLPMKNVKMIITENHQSWYIKGVLKKTPIISDGSYLQDFQFVIRCPYPYFRSINDEAIQIAGLNKLFTLPCSLAGIWYISKYTESQFTTIENKGNVPAEFTVVFTAAAEVSNPELYHVENRSVVKINKTMTAGEVIKVSTVYEQKGVIFQNSDGTLSNGFKYLNPNSDLNMQILPGINTIRCSADSGKQALSVKIIKPTGVKAGI